MRYHVFKPPMKLKRFAARPDLPSTIYTAEEAAKHLPVDRITSHMYRTTMACINGHQDAAFVQLHVAEAFRQAGLLDESGELDAEHKS